MRASLRAPTVKTEAVSTFILQHQVPYTQPPPPCTAVVPYPPYATHGVARVEAQQAILALSSEAWVRWWLRRGRWCWPRAGTCTYHPHAQHTLRQQCWRSVYSSVHDGGRA